MSSRPWPHERMFDRWGRALFCLGPGCTNPLPKPTSKKGGRPRLYCSHRCRVRWFTRDAERAAGIKRCTECDQLLPKNRDGGDA